jgi:hypothetical protein
MSSTELKHLANHELIRIAAEAQTNVDTVRRYLQGRLKRPSTIDRIEHAMRRSQAPQGASVLSSLPRNKA